MHQRLLFFFLLFIDFLPAFPAEPVDTLLEGQQIEQVVVTGTRTPKTLLTTPVLTQVISNADIRKADATNIRDLLQTVMPGVEFSYAQNQMVHLNFSGFGGQSVLILVDGERLAGETMDDVDFSRLMTDNVDHIEIVKGAASALYGSNAAGGVINIITKEGARRFGMHVSGRLSKHNGQRYAAGIENAWGRWANRLNINRTSVDNYDVANGDNPVGRVISTIFGEKTWHFNDQLSFDANEKLKLSGRAGYFFRQVSREVESPERYRDFNAGLRAQWAISNTDFLDATYSFDQYDKSNYLHRQRDVRGYSDVQNSIRLLYNRNIGSNMLTMGADYMHDYLMNAKLSGSKKQSSFDFFGQYDWNLNRIWEVVTALRYDYFSDHSMQRLTPKLSIRHTPLKHLNVRFGYGMGFRAPTLKEKYYDFDMLGIWVIEGNPNLKAEVSHNFNLSIEYVHNGYDLVVNGYCNNVRNKITSGNPYYKDGDTKLPRLPYINIDKFNVYGAEASARARWRCGITARLAYAFVHEDALRADGGNYLSSPYMPSRKHSLTGHIDWDHSFSKLIGFNIALDGRWLSGMDNNEFVNYYDVSQGINRIHYPAYSIFKLMVQTRIGSHIKVNLSADNLFNYRPQYHYLNSPLTDGTDFMIGASFEL